MTEPCDQLHAYVDGELTADETTAFEAHLASCDVCNDELPRLLALMTALDAAADRAASPAAARLTVVNGGLDPTAAAASRRAAAASPAGGRRRPLWIAAGVAAAAAAAAVLLFRPDPPAPAPQVASLAGDLSNDRTIEARLSYPGADAWRPRNVARGERSHEDISFARLGQLEHAGDAHGVGVASLLNGELQRASRWLAQAPSSPGVDSDRAALELADGSPEALERALTDVDRALAAAPNHAPALWNRGLALAAMNLPLAAARELDHVVALGEPGWADEARTRAAALRAQVAQRALRWKQANDAGPRWRDEGAAVELDVLAVTGYMTLTLYDAVRTAPSRARVEALIPMAQTLDRAYRSDRLTSYVRRIAASDFRIRGPLVEAYRRIVHREPMSDAAIEGLFKRLEQTATDDIRLGAMVWTGRAATHLEDYQRLAKASLEPWFVLIAEHEAASAEIARGQTAAAERRLRDAIALARRERISYRALQLEGDLETLHIQLGNLSQAYDEAQLAYREASAAGEAQLEMNFLNDLAAIAQDRSSFGLARGYLAEILERAEPSAATGPGWFDEGSNCPTRLYAYASLANISLLLFDSDRAREEISRAPACTVDVATQNALSVRTALVRTKLYRFSHRDEDGRSARESLAALRAAPGISDAQRAILAYLEGDLEIDTNRAAGERALRDAIAKANRVTDDDYLKVRARAYGFALLAVDAGRAGEFSKVIDLMTETLEVTRPDRCAIAIAVQGKQSVIAFSDARGEVGGQYTATPSSPELDVSTLVPATVVDRMRSCARIAVLARAPVLGASRLLPPELAWAYLLKDPPSGAKPGGGRRLVVANPELPPDLKLPPLRPYPDEPDASGVLVLRGAEATPTRVLLAMRDASVIEFHTHGFIANDVSEASYLLLSPELDRQYRMTARDVVQVKLDATPLVILGACHAAASSRSLEGGMGLAEAFLRAGARAVVASPDAIQDLGAHEFFGAVRDRVTGGADPAVAVRDERMKRLAVSHDDAWVSGVVVFE